jgi:hypothetical protein
VEARDGRGGWVGWYARRGGIGVGFGSHGPLDRGWLAGAERPGCGLCLYYIEKNVDEE